MFVSNRLDWGHLVDPSTFNPEHKHPDFYEIITNKWDWERCYIHPEYTEALKPEVKNLQVSGRVSKQMQAEDGWGGTGDRSLLFHVASFIYWTSVFVINKNGVQNYLFSPEARVTRTTF